MSPKHNFVARRFHRQKYFKISNTNKDTFNRRIQLLEVSSENSFFKKESLLSAVSKVRCRGYQRHYRKKTQYIWGKAEAFKELEIDSSFSSNALTQNSNETNTTPKDLSYNLGDNNDAIAPQRILISVEEETNTETLLTSLNSSKDLGRNEDVAQQTISPERSDDISFLEHTFDRWFSEPRYSTEEMKDVARLVIQHFLSPEKKKKVPQESIGDIPYQVSPIRTPTIHQCLSVTMGSSVTPTEEPTMKYIWSKTFLQQLGAEVVSHQLEKATPDIMIRMDMYDIVVAELRKNSVINHATKEEIDAENVSSKKVSILMKYVLRDPIERLLSMIEVLEKTNQTTLSNCIKKFIREGKEAGDKVGVSGSDSSIQWQENLIKAQINISKHLHLFKEVRNRSRYVVNIDNLFTKLDLVDNGEISGEGKLDVTLEETLTGDQKTVLYQGNPGVGKTSLLLHTANLWGKYKSGENCAPGSLLKNIDILLYVRTSDCKKDLETTVKEILIKRCNGDELSDEAYKTFSDHPEKSCIVLESIDEISNKHKLLDDLGREVVKNKRVLLFGVRKNDPVLERMELIHDNRVKMVNVNGFDKISSKEYIRKYFEAHNKRKEMGFSPEEINNLIAGFQKAIDENERLASLCSNPLHLSLVCFLLLERRYGLKDLKGVKKIEIFLAVVKCIFERYGYDPKEENQNLKNFSIYSFVSTINGSDMHEDEMRNFKIGSTECHVNPDRIPFAIIDEKPLIPTEKGSRVLMPHKAFQEFCGSECIKNCDERQQDAILALLVLKRQLNHILFFVLDFLEPNEEKLKAIVHAILCLQSDYEDGCEKCCAFQTAKDSEMNAESILAGEIPSLMQSGLSRFQPCLTCWKTKRYASSPAGNSVFQNALGCLDSANPSDRINIFLSMKELLPDKFLREGFKLYVPDKERYIVLRGERETVQIDFSNPADVEVCRSVLLLSDMQPNKLILHCDKYTVTDTEWLSLFGYLQKHPHFIKDLSLEFIIRADKNFLDFVKEHHQMMFYNGIKSMSIEMQESISMCYIACSSSLGEMFHLGWGIFQQNNKICAISPESDVGSKQCGNGLTIAFSKSHNPVWVRQLKQNCEVIFSQVSDVLDIVDTLKQAVGESNCINLSMSVMQMINETCTSEQSMTDWLSQWQKLLGQFSKELQKTTEEIHVCLQLGTRDQDFPGKSSCLLWNKISVLVGLNLDIKIFTENKTVWHSDPAPDSIFEKQYSVHFHEEFLHISAFTSCQMLTSYTPVYFLAKGGERWVRSMAKSPNHLTVHVNKITDITDSNVLFNECTKELKHLHVYTDQVGGLFGVSQCSNDLRDCERMISILVKQLRKMSGGVLRFIHKAYENEAFISNCENLLEGIINRSIELSEHGVQYIDIEYATLSGDFCLSIIKKMEGRFGVKPTSQGSQNGLDLCRKDNDQCLVTVRLDFPSVICTASQEEVLKSTVRNLFRYPKFLRQRLE